MIKFIRNLFNSRKQQCNIPDVSGSYYQMIQEREKERSIMMQKLENEKIERGIKREAERWLNEDKYATTIKIGNEIIEVPRINIMRPFITAILIYDEETAKYKGCNIQKLVSEEYQRLRSLNCH